MIVRYICFLLACLLCAACKPSTTEVSITGYNHMKRVPIAFFSVNGVRGSNVGAEGGGKESCCVGIPAQWRPGMKVKVAWEYDAYQDDQNPPLPSQVLEVDVPEYKKASVVQVHFYAGHKVKVLVSPCSPEHAFYPMSKQDLLPWFALATKEETLAAGKRGGAVDEC